MAFGISNVLTGVEPDYGLQNGDDDTSDPRPISLTGPVLGIAVQILANDPHGVAGSGIGTASLPARNSPKRNAFATL
jgi:hypothetical protein